MKANEIKTLIENALSLAFQNHNKVAGERWGDAATLRRLIACLLDAKEQASRLRE